MSKAPLIANKQIPQNAPARGYAAKLETPAREKSGAELWGSLGRSHAREEASDIEMRRPEPRYACNHAACVASANRDIATEGRIVSISATGARVEVMYPRRGPSITFLFDLVNGMIYECEVTWRTDFFIGVRFLDALGPSRRRKLQTGGDLPMRQSSHQIIQLEEPPKEELRPGPPPAHISRGASPKPGSGGAAVPGLRGARRA